MKYYPGRQGEYYHQLGNRVCGRTKDAVDGVSCKRHATVDEWVAQVHRYALSHGLSSKAAYEYTILQYWSALHSIPPQAIASGLRSPARQQALRALWDAGQREGILVRPATRSAHTTGDAWDLMTSGGTLPLQYQGYFASFRPGLRWGGNFRSPDLNHFDTRG